MGIQRHMKKKVINIEIQSIPFIAAVTAAALSAPYLKMHMMRDWPLVKSVKTEEQRVWSGLSVFVRIFSFCPFSVSS